METWHFQVIKPANVAQNILVGIKIKGAEVKINCLEFTGQLDLQRKLDLICLIETGCGISPREEKSF